MKELSDRPFRIKSPQLYRLSYRPKWLQSWWNRLGCILLGSRSVSPAYPNRVAEGSSTVPPAPISDDDVMAPYRRWGCP